MQQLENVSNKHCEQDFYWHHKMSESKIWKLTWDFIVNVPSSTASKMIMTPWEDLFFVINNLLLGEEPVRVNLSKHKSFQFNIASLFQSIEDFILLVGTSVAFIAFILWCCFPIEPKDSLGGAGEHLSTQVHNKH